MGNPDKITMSMMRLSLMMLVAIAAVAIDQPYTLRELGEDSPTDVPCAKFCKAGCQNIADAQKSHCKSCARCFAHLETSAEKTGFKMPQSDKSDCSSVCAKGCDSMEDARKSKCKACAACHMKKNQD